MNNAITRAIARRLYAAVMDRVVSDRRPDFTILQAGAPYMERWWVIPRNRWFNVYLHRVLQSDGDRAMHDHPWANMTIVLNGPGYVEFAIGGAKRRTFGDVVIRRPSAAHRLELVEDDDGRPRPTWTLFITGPRIRKWGFYLSWGWAPFDAVVGKTGEASWMADRDEAEIRAAMTLEAMENAR
jgi:hypothetical protein